MEEPNVTASAIINFAEKLEEDSAKFYEELAKRYSESKEIFSAFAKESEKNKTQVKRTYQETITDALEACFSFKGLNLGDYKVETNVTQAKNYANALQMAIELEEKASKFYSNVAELCQSLLATIPMAFRKVADRRNNRKQTLKSLLNKTATSR